MVLASKMERFDFEPKSSRWFKDMSRNGKWKSGVTEIHLYYPKDDSLTPKWTLLAHHSPTVYPNVYVQLNPDQNTVCKYILLYKTDIRNELELLYRGKSLFKSLCNCLFVCHYAGLWERERGRKGLFVDILNFPFCMAPKSASMLFGRKNPSDMVTKPFTILTLFLGAVAVKVLFPVLCCICSCGLNV